MLRHRFSLQDLALIFGAFLVVLYWLLEADLFTTGNVSTRGLEADELPILGGVVAAGAMIFAWRRLAEQKREIQRRLAAEERAHVLAFQDPLTGLANRRRFMESLREAVAAPPGTTETHAVLMLDLNGFKQINDVYGHGVGDEALLIVGERLLAAARRDDVVARLGGDEFAILALHLAGPEAVTGIALRITAALSTPVSIASVTHAIEAGVGICLFPFPGCTPEEILRRADVALYKAKADRRSSARFFDEEMDRHVRERDEMERELRAAIAASEISPFFQPLVDLKSNRIVGFEALARWTHKTLGEIPPERFIPIAEDSHLIRELSDDLLRKACEAAHQWPQGVTLSFNISPTQLRDRTLGLRIISILGETGLSPSRLQIEITESALVRDLAAAQEVLGALRQAGVRIALDDFGTGYSSLYHLRNFKIDTIKIDRSFIQNMRSEEESAEIVNALIGLGKGLGFTVTAEGVELSDQESDLLAKGCQLAQGFLFGAAVSAPEARRLFEDPQSSLG